MSRLATNPLEKQTLWTGPPSKGAHHKWQWDELLEFICYEGPQHKNVINILKGVHVCNLMLSTRDQKQQ